MLESVNEAQKQAITSYFENTSVIACPGSGKTRVLEMKTAYILEQEPTANIVAVTFTRDASIELAKRIKNRVGNQIRRVKVGTFHGLCMEQLKDYDSSLKIIDEYHQRQLIIRTIKEKNFNMSFEQGIKTIDYLKSRLHQDLPENQSTHLLNCYNAQLKAYGLLDFSDLLLRTTEGIRDGVIKPLNTNYLLIDEFQDTDPIQYAWVAEHANRGIKITCVGDDDQSIYSFRHALGPKGLIKYGKEFDAKCIKLGTNYRSHYEIINHAEQLILHNEKTRIHKEFVSHKGSGGSIKAHCYDDKEEECSQAIRYMTRNPNKWAVLGRNNKTLDDIEAELMTFKIPYTRIGGKRFWDKNPVTELIGLLNALVTKQNMGMDHALIYCGVQEKELDKLYEIAGDDVFDYLCKNKRIASKVTSAQNSKKIISKLNEMLPGWMTQLKLSERATKNVIRGVSQFLILFSPNENKVESLEIAEEALCRMKGTLAERLNLIRMGKKKKNKNEEEGVKLITFHSSKGLEFENVWLIGCQQGVIPHSESKTEEQLAEERRLFYVAMTRAEKNLHISYIETTDMKRSEFIEQAGLIQQKLDNIEELF